MLDGINTANGARIMQYSTNPNGANLTSAPISSGASGQVTVYVPMAANQITGAAHRFNAGRPRVVGNDTMLDATQAPLPAYGTVNFSVAPQ